MSLTHTLFSNVVPIQSYLQATEGRYKAHSVRVTDTVSHGTGLLDVREELCNNTHGFHALNLSLTDFFSVKMLLM